MLSQNGYVVFETTRTTGPLPRLRKWIIPGTDRHLITRDGSAGFVLAHMALWWHQKIERLDVGVWDEWGQAFRPVRGQSTGFSNHASGTAVDLNATQHPRGVALAKTFRAIQVARIRARLLTYRGVIRWGGDYTHSPVDGMHLEIVKGMTATERLARRLSASPRGRQILAANPGAAEVIWDGQVPPAVTKPAPTPKPLPPVAPRKPVQAERLAVDYSYSRPDPAAIKAAGYRGVVRYVSSKAAKNLTTTEATALRKAGLWIALVFEESAKRAGAGAKAGRLDAGFAEHQADLLGYPKDAVIFYAVDYDAAASEVRPYFDGLRAAAKRPVGVYGSNKVVMGVLADYYWQTVAWSDGLVSNKANWLQRTSHSHQIKGSKLTDWDENLLIGGKVPVWNAHEKPTPPPVVVPPIVVPQALNFITANFFKDNPAPADDIALLAASGADLIGLNEAAGFTTQLRDMPGYDIVTGTTHLKQQNPILVRIQDRVKVTGFEVRQMCDAVGDSPARTATLATYDLAGQHRAHIQTHLNAHIQAGGIPTDLPRTKEAIRHMVALEAWVTDLRAQGYRVTVSGDFNYAWTADDTSDWTFSPEAVFARLGMVSQFDAPTSVGPTLGGRKIDYFWFDPADLTLTGQQLVAGEHSDHSWPQIETTTLGEA